MKLNTTPYIVQELLDKGYISSDNKDKVAEVLANEGKLSKEYQVKSKILNYLEYFSGSLVKEVDVNSIYSNIKAKFKEDAELENGDIRYQVLDYLKKEKKLSHYAELSETLTDSLKLTTNVVEMLKPFQVVGYRKIL